MPDINTIHDQIRGRLAELEQLIEPLRVEAEQLTKLAATLDGQAFAAPLPGTPARAAANAPKTARKRSPRTAPAPPTAGAAKRGRPVGSGNRAHQAVAKISERPGITASELAKAMGIRPNYLYRVLPRLEQEAKVTKQGKGYHPAGDAAATAPTNGQPVTA